MIDAIGEMKRDYKIDSDRVYLMGHSMGGYGTWSVAANNPEIFAALAPISGGGQPAALRQALQRLVAAVYPGLGLLCTLEELQRERRGYYDAFCRLTRVLLLDHDDEDVDSAARRFKAGLGEGPVVLLYPDNARGYSPPGLTDLPWPTACFQIDSFSAPERRARWSRLFDAVFVFHPRSVQDFRKYRNRQVHFAPHGVRAEYFAAAPEEGRRLAAEPSSSLSSPPASARPAASRSACWSRRRSTRNSSSSPARKRAPSSSES